MSTQPEIIKTEDQEWENRHQTFTQPIAGLYNMWNAQTADPLEAYNAMTAAIQQFIAQAIRDRVSVRALGAGWSWTKIATTEGRMLNTKGLNARFDLGEDAVSPDYSGSKRHLLFAQCGCSIQELSAHLKTKNQCLCTSGASNGQTIAGALSTGTHGSAMDFGAIPEFVLGLHLILSPTRHIWLERASQPILADGMIARFGAEIVRDDALFNAALVSFGSFGFIHGVLFKTEDLFLLESYRRHVPLGDPLHELMRTLDFTQAGPLLGNTTRPFHFQVLINPYNLEKGAYSTLMYKHPFREDYTPPAISQGGHAPGDDAPAFLGGLRESIPLLVPFLVNRLIKSAYPLHEAEWGIPSEIFTNTDTHGKVLSSAFAVPVDYTKAVTDILLGINKTEGPFSGLFAFRFVKSTTATLGFTRFKPVSCVVEMDGLFSYRDRNFCAKIWDALEAEQIPYTVHWGKYCDLNAQRLENMYGERLAAWQAARRQLLDANGLRVFTNRQMTDWGL